MTPQKKTDPDMSGLGDDWLRYENLRGGQQDDQGQEGTSGQASATSSEPQPSAKGKTVDLGRRPPPAAAGSSALTVRFSPDEALEIDEWLLALRRETGQRLDKGEVIRELLRLARYHPGTRRTLTKRLGHAAPRSGR
jgi:hypothetical protein